ncbi:hypothetical protein BDN70DRAFT_901143 [Pholiota conissans]|uniref:Uncharacterized protein n=1 Tax=Pholiota conissans TaxID=109636 RepID=A0A9P5YPP9_9AGAR|nr:hypothetical protein BDN70DRAFT_901143 [Pholiota conissans]
MARTKQSANKSTGEPAPREPIPAHNDTAEDEAVAPIPAFDEEGPRRSKRKRKDTDAPEAEDIEGASAHRLVKIIVASATPVNHIESHIPGRIELPILRSDTDHDEYCCACRNGGDVYPCGTCLRVTCAQCVKVPQSPDTEHVPCPWCYLRNKEATKGQHLRYEMMGMPIHFVGKASTRERYLRCASEPLVIIFIYLQGFSGGGPPRIIYESLIPYLKTHVVFIRLDYCFATSKDVASYHTRSSAVVDLFTGKGVYAPLRCRRFSVFLASHSDPMRGDLHFAPGAKGANKAAVVLESLFGGRLGSHTDVIFLEKCTPASSSSITEAHSTGADTVATRYCWSHGTNRPFGQAAPVQCMRCYVLRPWLSKLSKDKYILKCQNKNCSNSLTYQPLAGATPVIRGNRGSELMRDDRGVWYKQVI